MAMNDPVMRVPEWSETAYAAGPPDDEIPF
jgi:hypothetical protein